MSRLARVENLNAKAMYICESENVHSKVFKEYYNTYDLRLRRAKAVCVCQLLEYLAVANLICKPERYLSLLITTPYVILPLVNKFSDHFLPNLK